MKHSSKVLSAVFAFSIIFGGLSLNPVQAQVAASGTAVAVPGYTVMPIQDYDRADDAIVQLNNLTIQSVNGAVLYVSKPGGGCMGFYSTNSYGRSIPCPLIAPNVLYQISISPETILLLKNRQRASLSDFQIGDRINVFGFLDKESQFMQALIVRDLDKPSPQNAEYYVQFNSVNVVSNPTSNVPPASFEVTFGSYPCALYSGPVGYRMNATCPVPMVPPNAAGVSYMPAMHTVQITGATRILTRDRVPASIGIIQAGDTLNIFGRYFPQTGNIEALIVRDLGTNVIPPQVSSLKVTVVDNSIRCITAPCGLLPGITVTARSGNNYYSGITDNNGAVYLNVPPGIYTVEARAENGRTASGTAYVNAGQTSITLNLPDTTSQSGLRVTSPNGGEAFLRGNSYPINWNTPPVQPGYMSAGSSYDIYAVNETRGSDYVGRTQYTLAKGVFLDFGITSGTYQWTAGQNLEGLNMPLGSTYKIRVCYAGTLNCDESDSYFRLDAMGGINAFIINSISPASGFPGTMVTLTGSGFTAGGNNVHFEMDGSNTAYLPNLSSNGNTLTFQVPSGSSYPCSYSNPACMVMTKMLVPGAYKVWVENGNGASNTLYFTLYQNTTTQ